MKTKPTVNIGWASRLLKRGKHCWFRNILSVSGIRKADEGHGMYDALFQEENCIEQLCGLFDDGVKCTLIAFNGKQY